MILLHRDIDSLNDFHKDMLRRIQHLPQRTALPIVYGLVGQFPIEFELHIFIYDNLLCLATSLKNSV